VIASGPAAVTYVPGFLVARDAVITLGTLDGAVTSELDGVILELL
jgi:hypothetical protein